ncbi:MAG TPA: radical SAM family heme chaperone HemW [Verrucomicrobiae bacterium]|jgi:oxygen-independent coproporphyrinogen-3 oxidase|nr:radical SAM family heme chaperone HemW [Verrucomicrobiae bacterium]
MTLGIYIQVPFCQTKCTYCNFHTGVVSRDRYEPYARAVCREISEAASSVGPIVDTAYFGGGTPSLLEPSALASILDTLRSMHRTESLEATLEADPETITPPKASEWLAVGFNRISLGVQSFDDGELRSAGRMHRRADTCRAAECLREAGFRNISMDLIAGLPHQTDVSWERSVGELLRLRPEHISIYMLEIDEGSRLGQESLAGGSRYGAGAIPTEDGMVDFYESACRRLAAEGYDHYEISNWALPGRRSRHNLKYWRREPYLGFGAGAHSFDGRRRWANVHDAAHYVRSIGQGISPRGQVETVTAAQALEEEFFLGLRQLEGIDLRRIERECDPSLSDRFAALLGNIRSLRSSGLVEFDGTRLRLAPERLAVSNEVLVALLG